MASICDTAFLMQVAAASAGVIAAIIWWGALRAPKPSDDIKAQLKATGGDIHVLDRLMQDVASQSRLNGHAAIFAALAIVLQVISVLFTSQACWEP
jgi:Transmembrane domain of unknown function (DUF3566)